MIASEYPNHDEGVTALVTARPDGRYGVGLRDDDAGRTVGFTKVYADRPDAERKAAGIVGAEPRFAWRVGDRVWKDGYPGVVEDVRGGMIDVRLERGAACVSVEDVTERSEEF